VREGRVCDFNFSENFTPGWTWTWQVPRAEFDQILADELAAMDVPVDFENGVTAIRFNGKESVTTVEDVHGEQCEFLARFIIDGSGYGRVIPRLFNLERASSLPPRKTVFTHLPDPNRTAYHEPNRITIVIHRRDVWIWIIPFSNGITSVGFVGNPSFFKAIPGDLNAVMRYLIASEPSLKDRFADVPFHFDAKTLESWSVTTDTFFGDGFVLTGNVTEFLDPVFSSGVTLATVSSHRAAQLVCRHLEGEKIDWQTEYTDYMMQGVDTFRSYVNGWYDGDLQDIFFAKEPNPAIQRQICSVLAGYVWDTENPYVKNHDRALKTLANVLRLEEAEAGGRSR
jgi:flavin-dependent dehydrogenase